ncbi:MAG: NRDE family protein [Pseudomonadota bacterium]|nr:NRDE family protein [Pseudomonadota bacterium]
MCLIAFALNAHPRYRLVVAANRDEFHARPTAAAAWWKDAPDIYGGRDLLQNGTWMACHRDGRWAAVTNVRRMELPDPKAPSRGALVTDFLRGSRSAADYAAALSADASRYAGFNLLLGDAPGSHAGTVYIGNQSVMPPRKLDSGIHAVSNASLDTPWPKLLRLRGTMEHWSAAGTTSADPLFAALTDEKTISDAELPDTGVGLALERLLSTPFIRSAEYGTRACTMLTIDHAGTLRFEERRFGSNGLVLGAQVEAFALR